MSICHLGTDAVRQQTTLFRLSTVLDTSNQDEFLVFWFSYRRPHPPKRLANLKSNPPHQFATPALSLYSTECPRC